MSLRESKSTAWCALLLVIALIILTISLGIINEVWEYSALFCGFMSAFCHLMAINLAKMSRDASRKLDMAALVFGVLTILSIIVIFILAQIS